MLIYEYKVRGNKAHYAAIDEAIRTTQFIRNKCLRLWMDTRGINLFSLHSYCAELAKQYPFAKALNSQARQVASERAWFAISRFYENCKQQKPGKKGFPLIAVAPHFTSQDCSGCHTRVKKSLSVRTHICPSCGLVLDRDENAARNILEKAVSTVGHTGTGTRTSANASGQKTATRRSVRATSKSSG